jgi:hypothetical protein
MSLGLMVPVWGEKVLLLLCCPLKSYASKGLLADHQLLMHASHTLSFVNIT